MTTKSGTQGEARVRRAPGAAAGRSGKPKTKHKNGNALKGAHASGIEIKPDVATKKRRLRTKLRTGTAPDPRLIADLKRSGLKPADIDYRFMPKGEGLFPEAESYQILYRGLDGKLNGIYRERTLAVDEWAKYTVGKSKKPKYKSPPGYAIGLYLAKSYPRSWAEAAKDTSVPLVIVEGEKKAEALAKLGYAVIAIGGVDSYRTKIGPRGDKLEKSDPLPELFEFEFRNRKVYVANDRESDPVKNNKIYDASERTARYFNTRGARSHIMVLPIDEGENKVGVDDFLLKQGSAEKAARAFRDLMWDETKVWEDPDREKGLVIEEFNQQHAVVRVGSKYAVLDEFINERGRRDYSLMSAESMRLLYANRTLFNPDDPKKPIKAFDYWLRHSARRVYERGIVLDPSGKQEEGLFNMWHGLNVQPRGGKCTRMLAHIKEVICDGNVEIYNWVMAWCAKAVQEPWVVPETCIVMRGGQGVGKGRFAQFFEPIFADHFLHLTNQKHLTSNFNAHTKNAVFLYADEAFWAGDRAMYGTLYGMVTEPTRMVEFKNFDAFPVKNYLHLLMASNHEEVVPAGRDSRRFCVLDVSERHKNDRPYFEALDAEVRGGGIEAFLDHLLKLDISNIDLRFAPRTKALLDQKLNSLDPLDRFWVDFLGKDDWEPRMLCTKVQARYQEAMDAAGVRVKSSDTKLGMALKKLVPWVKKSREVAFAPHNMERAYHYTFPPLKECRAFTAKRLDCNPVDLWWGEE